MKLVLLLALVSSSLALSQNLNQSEKAGQIQLNTITTAVPFMNMSVDARSSGIGSQGLATSADVSSLHWNTAQLGFSKKKMELTAMYSPWFRQLVDDIHLGQFGGYWSFGKKNTQSLGGIVSFFSLGEINFTDQFGNLIRTSKPWELMVNVGYALQLSPYSSIGFNGKYVYSELTNSGFSGSKAGQVGAADISYSYLNDSISTGNLSSSIGWGVSLTNLGNKISYTVNPTGDFIPANIRLNFGYEVDLHPDHNLKFSTCMNKLMVPTGAEYDGNGQIVSGIASDSISIPMSWIQSFYDAPGVVTFNSAGQPQTSNGSRFKEEMRELNFSIGLEYVALDKIKARGGYFHESYSKGNRKFISTGLGYEYYGVRADLSMWWSVTQNNPLANTFIASLSYSLN